MIVGYQAQGTTTDYYYNLQYSTATSSITSQTATAMARGTLNGKMRNTFGPLVVVNQNL